MEKQFEVWSERLRGQSRMETAVGNALALASRPRLAIWVLTDAVVRDPLAKGPVLSLGFLLGRSGPRDVEALWGRFRQTWSTLNLSDSRTFAAWLVGVEMLFHIDSDRAKSEIRNQFFPFFLAL